MRSHMGYVFFSDQSELWWLRFLRRGFRHCALIIEKDNLFILVDPLSHQLMIDVHVELKREDFAHWLAHCGMTYVAVEMKPCPLRAAPWGFLSCVEVIKRILGIRQRFIVTPWQLYNFLVDKSPKKEYIPIKP